MEFENNKVVDCLSSCVISQAYKPMTYAEVCSISVANSNLSQKPNADLTSKLDLKKRPTSIESAG
jgi:hypothetical protein